MVNVGVYIYHTWIFWAQVHKVSDLSRIHLRKEVATDRTRWMSLFWEGCKHHVFGASNDDDTPVLVDNMSIIHPLFLLNIHLFFLMLYMGTKKNLQILWVFFMKFYGSKRLKRDLGPQWPWELRWIIGKVVLGVIRAPDFLTWTHSANGYLLPATNGPKPQKGKDCVFQSGPSIFRGEFAELQGGDSNLTKPFVGMMHVS